MGLFGWGYTWGDREKWFPPKTESQDTKTKERKCFFCGSNKDLKDKVLVDDFSYLAGIRLDIKVCEKCNRKKEKTKTK